MRFTFRSDDRMVITIPLGSLREVREGQLMPERFTCVFKDVYKVFLRGQPKALGMSQLVAGVFVLSLGVLLQHEIGDVPSNLINHLHYTLPSILFIISGMLSYAAGHTPHMSMMKLSFAFNIVCIFWSMAAMTLCGLAPHENPPQSHSKHAVGLKAVVGTLLAGEMLVAIVMVYWESKAVCRDYFNILPTITLKQEP
ncbi:uncharacterized protein LOC143119255 isoform X1 [Alosa pseudoharengus]|uniref:membrane-spanning 4-domains subfamily A member 4A isoform X1 n=1 Tax=Alosa sapidissima TaxID=34773 RepID=UPI001C095777|nr:membrane-spanning 4-domains subfamily A member 4A isoform X1 [Alosa sapidissima]XP_041963021.1 membrane-spanning 4-domains subfamily A member 4A isoform X1 [Alosa sapidissima]XP_041963022.1 membrane-spanning 4-domains subfamily A member 4A isoform X1 [Alosa sapidissima]